MYVRVRLTNEVSFFAIRSVRKEPSVWVCMLNSFELTLDCFGTIKDGN